jgi:hypothetical protein
VETNHIDFPPLPAFEYRGKWSRQQILSLREQRYTLKEIAKAFGVSYALIHYHVTAAKKKGQGSEQPPASIDNHGGDCAMRVQSTFHNQAQGETHL